MPKGIYKRTPEMKTGKHMLGRKLSEEQKRKLSESHKGNTTGFQKGHKINLGRHWKVKDTSKISKAHKGQKHSEEAKRKISEAKKGNKHPNWQGGISFEPYSIDWTKTLKRSIRERDHYICRLCSQYGDNCHHIDYNKKNCNPDNLRTLCRKCNTRVNFSRDYWINYFTKIIKYDKSNSDSDYWRRNKRIL